MSASDRVDWQAWRKARKLEQQRHRRGMHPRIDYYPSEDVLALIRERTHGRVGGDQSSVIDELVRTAFRNKIGRFRNGGKGETVSTSGITDAIA
ncbi:hypothetical protein B0E46_09725 [Rhodanobacter sp. B04]|nr:hypothetical protein B0E46_09725 [Rhodanobacter sp. B04]